MGFKFTHLCDLLSSLEDNRILKATHEARAFNPDVRAVTRWFAQHGKQIRGNGTDLLALLSCMFPERRSDRVYWLQESSLARIIARCLLLGSSRREELERWRVAGGVDLGQCVENVMRQAENGLVHGREVTVEEIDSALNSIAARCRFSAPRVRKQHTAVDVEQALGSLYKRLTSRDAKWLTRMILKSYFPVMFPLPSTLRSFHFLLPPLLLFQDTFEGALSMLRSDPISHFPPHPEPGLAKDLAYLALQHLKPRTGVKIGRPDYYKARSIKHCCRMINHRRMSIERKYDGEYCQIHIDLALHPNSIQIFSKSGKDSTVDRAGIHQVIRDSLKIGTPGCKVSHRCILEGELLVWSDKHGKIMDFHKLRKLISRSGTFIGTESDSPPQSHEHLMIVFFDILLLDDNICLKRPHRERRLILRDTIQVIPGRADIAEQQVIDFSRHDGQSRLESIFSAGIAQRWEGFVLKGCEDPYFTIFSSHENNTSGRWIKLKKDYIPGLGDTLDLAIIGARYNTQDATALHQVKKLLWTEFYIGCLTNKDAVLQFNVSPKFKVVDVINRNCMSLKNMQILNQFGEFCACKPESGHGFSIQYGANVTSRMEAVFKTPFVVEVLGSGFEKPSNAGYFTLRFPRITKIHWDRAFEDAASYAELQQLAEDARAAPSDDLDEERNEWSKRVKLGPGSAHYVVNRSGSISSTQNSTLRSGTDTTAAISSSETSSIASPVSRILRRPNTPARSYNDPKLPTNRTIPIYTDGAVERVSSTSDYAFQQNPLTDNENLSAHTSRQREYANQIIDATQAGKPDPQHRELGTVKSRARAEAVEAGQCSSSSQAKRRTSYAKPIERTQKLNNSIAFPLMQFPVYITSTLSPEKQAEKPHQSLDAFLDTLTIHNTKTNVSSPSIGLVILAGSKSALGKLLFDLSKRITQALQSRSTRLPTAGKIFILDRSVLNLDDARLRLRQTWESIGRRDFYACVKWDLNGPGTIASKPLIHAGSKTLIECQRGCAEDRGRIAHRNTEPKATISFNRREMLLLGEL
ncbi:ATP dependent DNA ligase domain protein, partial [Aspergillus homomorphus CBS 101889]